VTDRKVLSGCARVSVQKKTKCWSVGTDYILKKLSDVSGLGLVEAERYNAREHILEKLSDVSGLGLVEAGRYNAREPPLPWKLYLPCRTTSTRALFSCATEREDRRRREEYLKNCQM
jgi:hypothetical protein